MGYGIVHKGGFKDLHRVPWRIFIEKNGHTDSSLSMVIKGSPLMIEHSSNSDDVFDPLHPSFANLRVVCQEKDTYKALFDLQEQEYKVNIYQGENLVTDWTNQIANPYETFIENGLDFEAANSSGNGGIESNLFSLTSGEKILVYFKMVDNGSALNALLSLTNEAWSIEVQSNLSEGWNVLELTAGWTGNSKFIWWSYGDADFEISEFFCIKKSSLYWKGWVSAGQYEQPYEPTPFEALIKASDGLQSLNNYLYKYTDDDPDDTYYEGRRLESQIILDILGKLGFTEFKEFINVYEEDMNSGVGDSPLAQSKVDVDVFKDMYCDEVLSEILKKHNACILQIGGVFCIYRPIELKAGGTIYGRHFTAATTFTATSFDADQYIKRSAHATNLKQKPGGNRLSHSPAKLIKVNQDYGNKQSWLEGYQFNDEDYYRGGNGAFLHWTSAGGIEVKRALTYIPGEKYGVVLANYNSYPANTKYIYQQFGTYGIIDADDIFGIEFDYQWVNNTGSPVSVTFYIKLSTVALSRYLYTYDDIEAKWDNATNYITITETVEAGMSGWINYKRKILGIPASGPYEVFIYALDDSIGDIVVAVKDFKFYSTQDSVTEQYFEMVDVETHRFAIPGMVVGYNKPLYGLKIKEQIPRLSRVYTKRNALYGKEYTYNMRLGDVIDANISNVIEQFSGALAVVLRSTLAQAAALFVTDHAADYADIDVTSSDEDIIMTGKATVNSDFTGSTTITNTSGNLSGTVANTQAFVAGVNKIQYLYPNGTNGTIIVHCTGVSDKTMTWSVDAETTCKAFVTANAGAYGTVGITITAMDDGGGDWVVKFEGFSDFEVTWDFDTGDMSAGVTTEQGYTPCTPRIVTITLTGLDGTANLLCDGVTKAVEVEESIVASDFWIKDRDSSGEGAELIDLMADEIKQQYSRTKDFMQMAIQELNIAGDESTLSLMKNFQDTENEFSTGVPRKFAAMASEFEVQIRQWMIDLIELV